MDKSWAKAVAEREAQVGVPTLTEKAKAFLTSSPTQLQTIKAAVAQDNLAKACGAAHKLSASAKALCFMQLHHVALDFETACLANNSKRAKALLNSLSPLVDICAIQLRSRYGLS